MCLWLLARMRFLALLLLFICFVLIIFDLDTATGSFLCYITICMTVMSSGTSSDKMRRIKARCISKSLLGILLISDLLFVPYVKVSFQINACIQAPQWFWSQLLHGILELLLPGDELHTCFTSFVALVQEAPSFVCSKDHHKSSLATTQNSILYHRTRLLNETLSTYRQPD